MSDIQIFTTNNNTNNSKIDISRLIQGVHYCVELTKSSCDYIRELTVLHNHAKPVFVEYWVEPRHTFTVDKKKDPSFLSSGLTYLFDDDKVPTIFTKITHEDYKYKEFMKDGFYVSFPRKYNHIVFSRDTYFGCQDKVIDPDQLVLYFNWWSERPSKLEDTCVVHLSTEPSKSFNYVSADFQEVIVRDPDSSSNEIKDKVIYKNGIFKNNAFENMLYKKESHIDFVSIIESLNLSTNTTFYLKREIKEQESLKVRVEKDMADITSVAPNANNRFLQRAVFQKMFDETVCKWILQEYSQYVKKNELNQHLGHAIPVEKMQNVFAYMMTAVYSIFPKIIKHYSLDATTNINIVDLAVVNDSFEQRMMPEHGFLTFYIPLLNTETFEFKDGIKYEIEQGSLLLFNSALPYIKMDNKCAVVCWLNISL